MIINMCIKNRRVYLCGEYTSTITKCKKKCGIIKSTTNSTTNSWCNESYCYNCKHKIHGLPDYSSSE